MSGPSTDWEAVNAVLGVPADAAGATVTEFSAEYETLIGFVPPNVRARLHLTGAIDPDMVAAQEAIRIQALNPSCLDQKTVQLILFGMLLMELSDACYQHGISARRAGASWEELQAVVNLCFVFRGVPAANRGAGFLLKVAEYEAAQLRGAK